MGQRHQFYVTARVGTRYRVLAALHHQWLWASQAVDQCLLVLQHFSRAANHAGIRCELRQASTIDWEKDIWVDESKKRATEALFPFIATCLFVSATSCIAGQRGGGNCPSALLFPINWHPEGPEMVNDDGITILDITEPAKPRYGFMFPGSNVLMDAEAYLAEYGDDADNVELSTNFGNLSLAAVKSTWPDSHFTVKLNRVKPEVGEPEINRLSLKDRSLTKLLDIAFESDDLEWVAEAELIPEFQSGLLARLLSKPELVASPSGVSLLGRALKDKTSIDLTPFELSHAEVFDVLNTAWTNKGEKNKALTLSTVDGMTEAGLRSIINTFAPTSLDLGDTPNIPLDKVLATIASTSVTCFTSSALYKRSLELIGPRGHLLPNIPPAGFPNTSASGFPISQMVLLRHCFPNGKDRTPRFEDDGILWSSLASDNKAWSEKDYLSTSPVSTMALPFSLRDSLISPERAQELLMLYAYCCTMISHGGMKEILGAEVQGIIKQFAAQSSRFPTPPIPAETYEDYRRMCWLDKEHPPKVLELAAGQWTFLALAEAEPAKGRHGLHFVRRLRYAFLTAGEDGRMHSAGPEDFFKATITADLERRENALKDWLETVGNFEKAMQQMTPEVKVEECSTDEVDEAFAYLEDYNAKIDAYEESNKERLEKSRQYRRDARANGQLTFRL